MCTRAIGRLLLRIKLYHSVRQFVITRCERQNARVVSLYLSITLSLSIPPPPARPPLTFRIYQAAQIVARLFGDLSHTITNASAPSICLLLAEFSRKRINLPSSPHLCSSPLSLSPCFSLVLFLHLSLSLFTRTAPARLLPRRCSTRRSQSKFIAASLG